VTHQLLDRSNVISVLDQVRGKAVPQRVNRGALGDTGGLNGETKRALKRCRVDVVATHHARERIDGESRSGEHPEPSPFLARAGKFPVQRPGNDNSRYTPFTIPVEDLSHARQVAFQDPADLLTFNGNVRWAVATNHSAKEQISPAILQAGSLQRS